jgi:class 3 adenylate cyclase
MSRRISDRLSEVARRSFFGRQAELAVLRGAIESPELPFVVAFIHGPGGIGKSCLLQAALSSIRPEIHSIVMDCREIEPTPKGLLATLGATLGMRESGTDLPSVVARLGRTARRTVLTLDTYETFGLMDTWLRQVFVPVLPESVLTIIAGRQAPNPAWLTTPGWLGLFHEIELRELPEGDSRKMLQSRGVTDPQAERVNRFARGYPLALELAAAALRTQPALAISSGPPPKVLQQLTHAFLRGLPPEITEAVEAASTVRRVTEPVLRALLAVSTARETFDNLRDLPFVDVTSEGLVLHDVVRDTVAKGLAQRDHERYCTCRRRAWRSFTSESHRAVARNLWQCTADLLYLIENPVIREAFFPQGASDYTVEPATTGDGDAIREIAASEDAEESGQFIARWWDRHPETFSVAKTHDGKVAAFYAIFEPANVDPDLLTDDPLTSAWLEHLRRNPMAPGERVLFLRRWLAHTTGELPSPAQAACWLDIKRTYMELRPHLRRLYTTVADLDTYAPIVVPLGFVPLEEARATLGGVTYHTALLDFGESSVDGWLASLVGAELGVESTDLQTSIDAVASAVHGERPDLRPQASPEGTVTILFTDIEGSTALAQRLGDKAYHALLAEHNRILREQVARHGGQEVKSMGDGFMVAFASAARALSCAVNIQKAFAAYNAERASAHAEPVEAPINVRIGLNTGESIEEAGDYFGTAVTLAARIAARAQGGQVLVSEVVRTVGGSLAGVEFRDAGRKQLKGIPGRQRVFEVVW